MSCRDSDGHSWVAVPSEQAAACGGPKALCNCGLAGPVEGKKIRSKQWLLALSYFTLGWSQASRLGYADHCPKTDLLRTDSVWLYLGKLGRYHATSD